VLDDRHTLIVPDVDAKRKMGLRRHPGASLEEHERVVGENLLIRSDGHLPDDARAQSSRRGSITLPKLRIALRTDADDEPDVGALHRCRSNSQNHDGVRVITAGAIGGISENAPTRLSLAHEAEEASALK
jgi:hypothetical protein